MTPSYFATFFFTHIPSRIFFSSAESFYFFSRESLCFWLSELMRILDELASEALLSTKSGRGERIPISWLV